MRKVLLLIACFFSIALSASVCKRDSLFNKDWRFVNHDVKNANALDCDDSEWRSLNLPHDWAIEGPFDEKYNPRCGGLPFYGTGWYRKHFVAPKEWKGKVIRIEFEGAMAEAQVWLNGKFIGERPYGYMGFELDLSKHVKLNEDNVIAVKLAPKDLSARWYPGAGIYRNVWLKVDQPIHVDNWGTFVTTPTVSNEKTIIQVETTVANALKSDESVNVKHTIYSPDNKVIAVFNDELSVQALSKNTSQTYTTIKNPTLWQIDSPKLYHLTTTIIKDNEVVDEYDTRFGIRSILFKKDGFYLNHKRVQLNGVCLHHDNGPLGSAFNRRADQRKLEIMKDMGVNAIRTSHNPQSPGFLDLCDEMGFVVLDEAFDEWTIAKVKNGYSNHFDEWSERDMKDFIRRDRNHPCVIMWSIGNEILEQSEPKKGFTIAKKLVDYCKEMDRTRPTTAGFNHYPATFNNNVAQQVDIKGLNYKPALYAKVRKLYPDMVYYGSETSSCTSSRGVYHLPIKKYTTHKSLQVTSYDLIGPPWAYPPDIEFNFLEKNPEVLGEFIWTGFDYLGEPTPYGGKDNSTTGQWKGNWPSRSSYFGAVDLCGIPKDRFFLYQSHWTTKPMLHVLPHWNWEGKEGTEIPVYVYTNCDEVELFLNGKSLGKRVKGKDLTELLVDFRFYEPKTFKSKYRLSWFVPYEKGTLLAKGYKDGKLILEEKVATASKPAKIELIPDRKVIHADGKDLCYVTVNVRDRFGNICPLADNLINFKVSGKGYVRAVGNGNAATTEPFQASFRKAFNGKCMLIVQTTDKAGKIKIKASSKGLRSARIEVSSK